MNDTVYRQDAIDAVISLCDDCDSDYCGYCRVNIDGGKDARKVLEDLPSAQSEIIRCKDCKHNHNCDIQYYAQGGSMFYCAAAEREADAEWVKIVRCRDCKHSEHWYKDKRRCFLWHEEGIDVFEDGFCNYVERREE